MDGPLVRMSVYFFDTCTLHRISDMQVHKSTWDLDEPYFHGLFVLSQIHLNKSLRFLCFLRNCVLLQAQLSSRNGGPFSHEINLQNCQQPLSDFEVEICLTIRVYPLASSGWAQFSDQVSWTIYHQRWIRTALYTDYTVNTVFTVYVVFFVYTYIRYE